MTPWQQLRDDAAFLLRVAPLAFPITLLALPFLGWRDVFGVRSSVPWSPGRRNFVRITAGFALATPPLLFLFAVVAFRHEPMEVLPEFQPVDVFPIPDECRPVLYDVCYYLALSGVAAAVVAVFSGKGCRGVITTLGVLSAISTFFAWFNSMCAISGVWP